MSFLIKKFTGRSLKAILVAVALLLTLLITATVSIARYRATRTPVQTINYSELYALAEQGTAASVVIESDQLIVKTTGGAVYQSNVAGESFRQTIVELFRKNHVPVEFASTRPPLVESAL